MTPLIFKAPVFKNTDSLSSHLPSFISLFPNYTCSSIACYHYSVCLSAYLSVCLSVYLSIYLILRVAVLIARIECLFLMQLGSTSK